MSGADKRRRAAHRAVVAASRARARSAPAAGAGVRGRLRAAAPAGAWLGWGFAEDPVYSPSAAASALSASMLSVDESLRGPRAAARSALQASGRVYTEAWVDMTAWRVFFDPERSAGASAEEVASGDFWRFFAQSPAPPPPVRISPVDFASSGGDISATSAVGGEAAGVDVSGGGAAAGGGESGGGGAGAGGGAAHTAPARSAPRWLLESLAQRRDLPAERSGSAAARAAPAAGAAPAEPGPGEKPPPPFERPPPLPACSVSGGDGAAHTASARSATRRLLEPAVQPRCPVRVSLTTLEATRHRSNAHMHEHLRPRR